MNKEQSYPSGQPPQHQSEQPGSEKKMIPRPVSEDSDYAGSSKLLNKNALITIG